jgi:predicted phosphoribosyltransferase
MRAAVMFAREQWPARVVVGAPVGSADACRELAREADEVVCAVKPDQLGAVGAWYEDFTQTTDDEVRELLARAEREHGRGGQGRMTASE